MTSENSGDTGTGHRAARRSCRAKWPTGWEAGNDAYDYLPLRLPPEVTRVTASMRLAIQAEFGGWELSRVRLYTDGSRRVLLRRRKPPTSTVAPAENSEIVQ